MAVGELPKVRPARAAALPFWPSVPDQIGAVAQLGERYNGIVEVVGSIPSGSTTVSCSNHRKPPAKWMIH